MRGRLRPIFRSIIRLAIGMLCNDFLNSLQKKITAHLCLISLISFTKHHCLKFVSTAERSHYFWSAEVELVSGIK